MPASYFGVKYLFPDEFLIIRPVGLHGESAESAFSVSRVQFLGDTQASVVSYAEIAIQYRILH